MLFEKKFDFNNLLKELLNEKILFNFYLINYSILLAYLNSAFNRNMVVHYPNFSLNEISEKKF